ncbi:HAD family phosphatase [Agromyces protaetiae]|uniref:HAD family phosphatase n=1 Tax=Agromyces protaetiae TaxID=2509455 RepID=A0A4P6FE62_9MICO|nr:HAD family phosphatase [Agromyces protaetiae]QAY74520.1 HAD family phosphatase [Agromyces protaetiae]
MPPTALAPISLAPRVVVFDYGEVISTTPTDDERERLAARAGFAAGSDAAGSDAAAFWTPYWAHRLGLDQGVLSIADYWRAVGRDAGVEYTDLDVHELWSIDHRSWLSVDPGTLAVLHALSEGGTRLALLSNAGADFSGWLRHGSFAPLFERVFVSGELGLVKPDAAIYEHVISELGITPAEFVFIDNRDDNVEGAIAVGGSGHVFTGAGALEAWLREEAE